MDAGKCTSAGIGVPAVQSADPDGKGQIERRLARLERELLDRSAAKAQDAVGELPLRGPERLPDSSGRPVDPEHIAGAHTASDLTSGRPRPAADLQHSHARPQWKGIDDCLKAEGQPR